MREILRLLGFLCCLGFPAMIPALAFAAIDDGLISVWTFDDGTAKDSAGSNHGTLHGGVKAVDGKFGKALDFNGVDAFVQIPHDESMEAIADGMSVSAWVYIRTFVQNPNHAAIICKGEHIGWGSNYAFRIATREQDQLTWAVNPPGSEQRSNTSNAAEVEKWLLLCLTADGTQWTGYVADEEGNVNIPSGPHPNPKPVVGPYQTAPDFPIEIGVGRSVGGTVGNDAFFDGIIDEMYLWDRALSEDEIVELAKGGRPRVTAVEAAGKLPALWGKIKR